MRRAMASRIISPWQAVRHAGPDDTLARLGACVDAWERELGSVVADEAYDQLVTRLPRSGVTREPNTPPRPRCTNC